MEHKTLSNSKVDLSAFQYEDQNTLTRQLDELSGDFTQTIVNQIVLWKVNRYAEIDKKTFKLLNTIDKSSTKLDLEFTRQILKRLLVIKGIGLPMASTILRFKNPNIYQIIDQRAYRIINEQSLKIPSNIEAQIDLYLQYLNQLKEVCKKKGIQFCQADRILYLADKEINRKIPINY